MATYFPGSNMQTDTMQTLYLMNPDYAGYADLPAPANMVLINHSTGSAMPNTNLVGSGQLQPHFIGIPFPSAPPPQRSSIGTVENSPATHQGVSSSLLSPRIGNHGYNAWRNVGNELTFIQATESTGNNNQSLSGQLNNFASLGHQPVSEFFQTGMRHASLSSIQEQQLGMNPSGLGLQLDQSHGSTRHGQGLSLSLSPQQLSSIQLPYFQNQPSESAATFSGISQAIAEENMNRTERVTNKWGGGFNSLRASSRDGMLGTGFTNSLHGPGANKRMDLDANSTGMVGLPNSLVSSKYFKAAQQLLDEIVNVGKGIKPDSTKHQKSQTWFGTLADKKTAATEANGKDGTTSATTGTSTSAHETNDESAAALTPADRQELQMKKAKLVAMLDEVDRRYRQYYHQLQIVVSSFEAGAGFGSAKTYTALALQRISSHFRSLRDAITGQIRLTSKNLGEEDTTASGKGEASRLQFVDQQLRQQRALQQLGMIQQHAWRPQRGLPERSVSVLRAWLFEHFLHPYPKDADKHVLARQTGLTRNQVSNWFINARVRLWKPMVEEMYLEETREVEAERNASDEKVTKEGCENKEEMLSKEGIGNRENDQQQKYAKSMQLDICAKDGGSVQQSGASSASFEPDHASDKGNDKIQTAGMVGASDGQAFHEVQKEGTRQGLLKKARNGVQDSIPLLSPNINMDVDLKPEETGSEYGFNHSKFDVDERHATQDYNLLHNKLVHSTNCGSFGAYQIGGLSRYGQESFTPKFSGSGGVSLTLGLQHCDDLSLAGTKQSYGSNQDFGSGRRHGIGNESDDYCNMNGTSATHPGNNYDHLSIQNRKRFATQLLHDFVA